MKEKRYIIRKYVIAKSIADALKKEKKALVEECFVDNDWLKENKVEIGFKSKR